MKQLDVFMTGELIGHLREDGGGAMAFAYSHSWLGRGDAVPLGSNLPLDEQWHDGEAVTTYFDNLLPEGSVRDFVARALQSIHMNVEPRTTAEADAQRLGVAQHAENGGREGDWRSANRVQRPERTPVIQQGKATCES